MMKRTNISSLNVHLARKTWGDLHKAAITNLRALSEEYALAVAHGDLQFLDGRWYVTHTGLLQIARRNRCSGIRTTVEKCLSDPANSRWVFKATVYKSPRSRGFVGYGDADPSNVSSLVHGAEMRVAETRAVNRALRKAYGIGFVRSRSSAGRPDRIRPDHPISARLPRTEITATTTACLASATVCAC